MSSAPRVTEPVIQRTSTWKADGTKPTQEQGSRPQDHPVEPARAAPGAVAARREATSAADRAARSGLEATEAGAPAASTGRVPRGLPALPPPLPPGSKELADKVIEGFKQTGEGNCVSVASIKAAMVRFGATPAQVFSDVKKSADGGASITMRDGFKVTLTAHEIKEAAAHSGFTGKEPILSQANMMFAAEAKRDQLEHPGSTFKGAVKDLDNGLSTVQGFHLLGLDASVKAIDPSTPQGQAELAASNSAVVTYRNADSSAGHMVYDNAGTVDLHGTATPLPGSYESPKNGTMTQTAAWELV